MLTGLQQDRGREQKTSRLKPGFQHYACNAAQFENVLRKVLRNARNARFKTACKRNRTCSNLMQGTQEVANGIARICHVIQDNGSIQSVKSTCN